MNKCTFSDAALVCLFSKQKRSWRWSDLPRGQAWRGSHFSKTWNTGQIWTAVLQGKGSLTLGKREAISVTAEWIFSEHGTKLEPKREPKSQTIQANPTTFIWFSVLAVYHSVTRGSYTENHTKYLQIHVKTKLEIVVYVYINNNNGYAMVKMYIKEYKLFEKQENQIIEIRLF